MTKIKHDYICDECGKPATHNIQDGTTDYSITEDGDFVEDDYYEGVINRFYCDECYENS